MTPWVWWKPKDKEILAFPKSIFSTHDIKWDIKLSDHSHINALIKRSVISVNISFRNVGVWMTARGKTKSTDLASVIAQIVVHVRAPSGVPTTRVTLPVIVLVLSKALTELHIHLGRKFPGKLQECNTIAWASSKSFTWAQSPGSTVFKVASPGGIWGPQIFCNYPLSP